LKGWLLWLILVALLAPPALAQNLVLNGGFETGTFSSWTQTGDTGFTAVSSTSGDPSAPSPQGTYHAYFGPLTSGGIYQNFATIVGTVYRVSFSLNSGLSASANRSFRAQAGRAGSPLTTYDSLTNSTIPVNTPANPHATAVYAQRSFTFTATNTTSRIQFLFENDPDYWRLDNIIVTRAVPEIDLTSSRLPLLMLFCGWLLVCERRRSAAPLL